MEKFVKTHREKFPKIREITRKGETKYQIDCRRQGKGSKA